MAEKTIKISDEIYAYLESLRKENEEIEEVLVRLLSPKDTSASIDDVFGKWVGSDKEFESIQKAIDSTWNEWNKTLQASE